MNERIAIQVFIEGRVQGVGYRAWVVREARARNLSGWVRNKRDGSVEAIFSGPKSAIESMIEACSVGPTAARVTSIAHKEILRDNLPSPFQQSASE